MKTSVQFALVVLAASTLLAKAEGRQEETPEAPGIASVSSVRKASESSLRANANIGTKLQLNFQNAAVDLVLDYLSAAGGSRYQFGRFWRYLP